MSAYADVVVIGGGPAGSATATRLARAGLKVDLFERMQFPRLKPCGDFLTPGAMEELSALGIADALVGAGVQPVERIQLERSPHCATDYTGGGSAVGWAVERRVLDSVLLNAAQEQGVRVHYKSIFRALVAHSGRVAGVKVQSPTGGNDVTYMCDAVVGADGSASRVARQSGLVLRIPGLTRLALVSHWEVGLAPRSVEMRSVPPIVCGYASLPGGRANVTLVVPSSQARQIAAGSAEFVRQTLKLTFPELYHRLSSGRLHGVSTVPCKGHVTVCRTRGVHLVGDAATFVDPFTGEGVYMALRGARSAADRLLDSFCSSTQNNLQPDGTGAHIGAAVSREMTQRYLLSAAVQAVVRNPAALTVLLRGLQRCPTDHKLLHGVLADTLPVSAFASAPRVLRLALAGLAA